MQHASLASVEYPAVVVPGPLPLVPEGGLAARLLLASLRVCLSPLSHAAAASPLCVFLFVEGFTEILYIQILGEPVSLKRTAMHMPESRLFYIYIFTKALTGQVTAPPTSGHWVDSMGVLDYLLTVGRVVSVHGGDGRLFAEDLREK